MSTRTSGTDIKSGFIVDVSACMPWCCEDEATTASDKLLRKAAEREALHVPSIWPWELMNALAITVRRQRITPERSRLFLEQLAVFNLHVAPVPALVEFAQLSDLASRHRLTAYDAAYLSLAMQLALPLATLDDDLTKAAIAEGISLL